MNLQYFKGIVRLRPITGFQQFMQAIVGDTIVNVHGMQDGGYIVTDVDDDRPVIVPLEMKPIKEIFMPVIEFIDSNNDDVQISSEDWNWELILKNDLIDKEVEFQIYSEIDHNDRHIRVARILSPRTKQFIEHYKDWKKSRVKKYDEADMIAFARQMIRDSLRCTEGYMDQFYSQNHMEHLFKNWDKNNGG